MANSDTLGIYGIIKGSSCCNYHMVYVAFTKCKRTHVLWTFNALRSRCEKGLVFLITKGLSN